MTIFFWVKKTHTDPHLKQVYDAQRGYRVRNAPESIKFCFSKDLDGRHREG